MDIVVVGSCNTDLISFTHRQPKPGETVHGHKFVTCFGGKGANQCVMSAKLGAKTALVAKLGKDSYGDNTLTHLKVLGVNTDHVHQSSEASSGIASIIVSEDGQNSIVIVGGANSLLSEEDVTQASEIIKNAKVLVCQLEVPPSASLLALHLSKCHGVFSIFNPAPAVNELDPVFFSSCDVLCANESEAELLTGVMVDDVASAKTAAEILHTKGCETVIITLGEKGSVLVSAQHPGIHVPATPVKAIDTTGAGDAYIGALAYYKAVKPSLTLLEAVQRASKIAAISCQNPGAQDSFPVAANLPQDLFV